MTEIFTFSDGSTTIDLFSGNYELANFDTGLNQWKDGGIFADNQLAEGSIPIFRQFDTFEEKLTVHIKGTSQNEVIASARALLTLLESGVEFFITGFGNQLYISVKGDQETNTRYAVVTAYKWETLPAQFGGAFVQGAVGGSVYTSALTSVELIIRRGIWLEAPPGSPVRAYLDSQSTFNSVAMGVAASNSEPVYVANYRTTANITHIYRFDASGASFSSNLIASSLPFNLFPSTPAVGDFLYLGSSTAVTDAGPFFSAAFNIGTPAPSDMTISAQYWNGSSWTAASTIKSLSGDYFRTAGPELVSWIISGNDWAANAINGVTAYWVRFEITGMTTVTNPTQVTRGIYSVNVPYVDVLATNLAGDVEPIIRVEAENVGATLVGNLTSLVIGRRLYSRGANFMSHINLSDVQSISNITISNLTASTFVDDFRSVTGRAINFPNSSISTYSPTARVYFNSTIASHYIGRFRAFVKVKRLTDVQGNFSARLSVGGSVQAGSSVVVHTFYPEVELNDNDITSDVGQEVLDFGIIELPASLPNSGQSVRDIAIDIAFKRVVAVAASTVRAYQLILIPADESIIEMDVGIPLMFLYNNNLGSLFMDKTTSPEEPMDIYIENAAGVSHKPVHGGSESLTIGKERSRLYFFGYNRLSSSSIFFNEDPFPSGINFGVEISKLNRYLLPRGAI